MSRSWRHNICETCWQDKYPNDSHEPSRMMDEFREREICCWCGLLNRDGIYLRENPGLPELVCKGIHSQMGDQ